MTIATSYARALHSVVEKTPTRSKEFIQNLKLALERRGHTKLFPYILREYEKLESQKKRSASQAVITPEIARTDTLLQLYRKLIETK